MVTRPDLVRRLMKDPDDILSSMDPFKMDLLHATIGMAGEARELMEAMHPDAILTELGDCSFYFEALCQWFQTTEDALLTQFSSRQPVYYRCLEGAPPSLRAKAVVVLEAGGLLELVKKHVVNGHEFREAEALEHMARYAAALQSLAVLEGFTEADVNEKLVEKLGARYDNLVYSDSASISREDVGFLTPRS